VVISADPILFPKVIHPNILVCLSQQAYNRYSASIRPGGLLLTDKHLVSIDSMLDARHVELPMHDAVMGRLHNHMVLNICMLGALLSLTNMVRVESVKKVLEKRIPPEFVSVNVQAMEIGREIAAGLGVLWEMGE